MKWYNFSENKTKKIKYLAEPGFEPTKHMPKVSKTYALTSSARQSLLNIIEQQRVLSLLNFSMRQTLQKA